jgi:hypothetical protein
VASVKAKLLRPTAVVVFLHLSCRTGKGVTQVEPDAKLRMRKAVDAMLQTAPDIASPPEKCMVDTMLAAMSGVMRSLLEARPSPTMVRNVREQLVLLCQSYMAAAMGRGAQG